MKYKFITAWWNIVEYLEDAQDAKLREILARLETVLWNRYNEDMTGQYNQKYPPSPFEVDFARLTNYLSKIEKRIGWKGICECVGKYHRENNPANPYTSFTYYDPSKAFAKWREKQKG